MYLELSSRFVNSAPTARTYYHFKLENIDISSHIESDYVKPHLRSTVLSKKRKNTPITLFKFRWKTR